MASPATTPPCRQRQGQPRAQLPHCYHDGYLYKWTPEDKVPRQLWTCLCGNTLLFFNNNKDTNYVEKLDLSGFVSLTDGSCQVQNLKVALLCLRLKDRVVKLAVPTPDKRELWKGYIYAVTELSLPSSLNLLPGQLCFLREVVEKERQRRKAPTSNVYLSLLGDMPSCYRKVSRTEAMMLLSRHPTSGNMLLRPGSNDSYLAITTYQYLDRRPMFKNYRVSRKPEGGFAIDLKTPIPCATLDDVLQYLVHETGGVLKPFTFEETYEDHITFVRSNSENGEVTLCAVDGTSAEVPTPPKPAPCGSPSPEPEWDTEESFYLNDDWKSNENSSHSDSDLQPPAPPPKPVKMDGPPQSCLSTNHQSKAKNIWEFKEGGDQKSCLCSGGQPPVPPPKPGGRGTFAGGEKVPLIPPQVPLSHSSASSGKPLPVRIFTSSNPTQITQMKEVSEQLKDFLSKHPRQL
ncbi:signal-transducing adaptor protein 2 [Arapaima gigas]